MNIVYLSVTRFPLMPLSTIFVPLNLCQIYPNSTFYGLVNGTVLFKISFSYCSYIKIQLIFVYLPDIPLHCETHVLAPLDSLGYLYG